MADESNLERTEPASPRRLEQAREEGQVPRSTELSTFAIVMAGAGALWTCGAPLAQQLLVQARAALAFERTAAFDASAMLGLLHAQTVNALLAFLPFGLFVLAAGVAAPLLLGGWVFSARALQPDFARLNPVNGFQRMCSLQSLADLGRSLLKAALLTAAALWSGWLLAGDVVQLSRLEPTAALARTATLVGLSFLPLLGAVSVIALIDVPYQLWNFHRKLRMTREEVRRESKEMEGDPQVKARVRSLQRDRARRRMMAEVPKADVVVTNPVHYAVALRYREGQMRAPQVVAKGAFLIAARIRELAEAHRVPVVEAPPLARALYRHAELDQEVPVALYTAVAEVLAYVHQLRRSLADGRPSPQAPERIDVPAGLDPGVLAP